MAVDSTVSLLNSTSPMSAASSSGSINVNPNPLSILNPQALNGSSLNVDDNGSLSTASNKGGLDDNKLSFQDSIGGAGDLNDYFKFTLTSRNNLAVSLSNIGADFNVELLNNTGNRIDASERTGTSADTFTQILSPGEYYIRVYQGVPDAQSNYQLDLNTVKLSGDISNKELYRNALGREVDAPDKFFANGANFYQFDANNRTDQGIEANKNTIVVIHGRNFADKQGTDNATIKNFATALAGRYGNENYQVLGLDWRDPASDESQPPYFAARSITPVADWAQKTLAKLGIASQQITPIGHSLGAYVAAEIGRLSQKVKSLVALDPAFPGTTYDVDGNTPGNQRVKDFKDVANYSISFVVSDQYAGASSAGDNNQAATAHDSFVIRFEGYEYNRFSPGDIINAAGKYHNDVIEVYKSLVANNYSPPLVARDRYDNYGSDDSLFRRKQHEGAIKANWQNNAWNVDRNFDVAQNKDSQQIFWI